MLQIRLKIFRIFILHFEPKYYDSSSLYCHHKAYIMMYRNKINWLWLTSFYITEYLI